MPNPIRTGVRALLIAGSILAAPAWAAAAADPNNSYDDDAATAKLIDKSGDDGSAIEGVDGRKLKIKDITRFESVKKSTLSDEFFEKLDQAVDRHGYTVAFENLKKIRENDPKMLAWAERQVRKGNLLIAWFLADRLVDSSTDEALEWGYIATLASKQESAICADPDAVHFSGMIGAEFQAVIRASRANPYKRTAGLTKAMNFLREISPSLSAPVFFCKRYESAARDKRKEILYPDHFHAYLRAKARNAMIRELGLPLTEEEMPKVESKKIRAQSSKPEAKTNPPESTPAR